MYNEFSMETIATELYLPEEGNKSRCGEWKDVKDLGNIFSIMMPFVFRTTQIILAQGIKEFLNQGACKWGLRQGMGENKSYESVADLS